MAERRIDHTSNEQVMATIKNEQVRFINLEFTDVVGVAKCVTIPAEQLIECVRKGKWFDGSALENIARVVESDMYLYPDLATFAILPGNVHIQSATSAHQPDMQKDGDIIARAICDIREPDGERFEGDPRAALFKVLEEARAMGFNYQVGPELEILLTTI